MRQPLLFMDLGNGWENLTGHEGDVAALDSFTVDWGTDDAGAQPDVSVLKYRLADRTGQLAGRATTLAGAKVWVQLSRMPFWRDCNVSGAWSTQPATLTWARFHEAVTPDVTAAPDPTALTLFRGRNASGGTITRTAGGWRLDLTANSMLTQAKRQTSQGPASTDARLTGWHWTGTPTQRLTEIQARLTALGAPSFDEDSRTWLERHMPPMAPYKTDSYPALLTLIQNLASASPLVPLVYERHTHGTTALGLVFAGRSSSITMHADGWLTVESGGLSTVVIPGEQVQVDDTALGIPDPVSNVTLKGRKVTWSDQDGGRFNFEDDEQDYSSRGLLPANLTETEKSATIETDAILSDETEGKWTGGTLTVSRDDRDTWARWIQALTMRLRPQSLTTCTRRIDIDEHEDAFTPTAFPLGFIRNTYTRLTGDDGTPSTSGAWLATGGTLTFEWQSGRPVLSNELDLQPLPMIESEISRWKDLTPIVIPWTDVAFSWHEFGQITYFQP